MTRVVAQGTFDLLHPGHVHYLRDAAAYGDELQVIVARGENVTHKPRPILSGHQRRDMVAALDVVDEARLGDPEDIFAPIEAIDPDVIVLGFDQHHDEPAIERALADRGIDCRVERASAREPRHDDELLSTGDIIDRILHRRGTETDTSGDGGRTDNGERAGDGERADDGESAGDGERADDGESAGGGERTDDDAA